MTAGLSRMKKKKLKPSSWTHHSSSYSPHHQSFKLPLPHLLSPHSSSIILCNFGLSPTLHLNHSYERLQQELSHIPKGLYQIAFENVSAILSAPWNHPQSQVCRHIISIVIYRSRVICIKLMAAWRAEQTQHWHYWHQQRVGWHHNLTTKHSCLPHHYQLTSHRTQNNNQTILFDNKSTTSPAKWSAELLTVAAQRSIT